MMAQMDEEDLERSRAGGWDPELRIRDQDREGVHGEVIFGPLFFDNSPDPRIDLAISRAFNDWSAEIFNQSVHKDRFAVSAALAVADIPAAVAEVERAAGLGFRCINLPAQQPHLPYNRPDYDPLWAALQDSGMVANFHIGTGHVPQGERGPGGPTINYVIFAQGDGPHIVSYLCASGVLERFPRLQWAVVESGAAWLAWVLESLDQIYQKHHMFHRPMDKLELLPSEYFKRQGHACFMDDAVAVHNREFTGCQTPDVRDRLSASRRDVPAHAGGDRPDLRRRSRARDCDDRRRERGQALRLHARLTRSGHHRRREAHRDR